MGTIIAQSDCPGAPTCQRSGDTRFGVEDDPARPWSTSSWVQRPCAQSPVAASGTDGHTLSATVKQVAVSVSQQ